MFIKRGRVLLAKRPSKGLLGGMWEFPNGRVDGEPSAGLGQALKSGYGLRLGTKRQSLQETEPLGVVRHGYSHFSVTVYAYRSDLAEEPGIEQMKWVPLRELDDYPMGRIDRQIANMLKKK